ncbi:efflux RND transporter periplasmic adaptor subunit [Thalassomonas actiniarum]|uniref:Efflux RND transporter periplasmic adaptor subunit n=1 Tax=Thalassomonas actiniarum TaxID=485447 RepID=A0AAE9YSB0_9GAMM|nr:efflux RND transporter periplasmic adaptor subunit [Thalassomonas actiniarum]WDD98651.1 efflux RND transporter periplasmic adaptor subunit [Thalassomonas actiniarum]
MKNITPIALGVLLGTAATLAVTNFIAVPEAGQSTASAEKKPLYWVAPMDANYKRDKPGKSPMGMDLVPVYDDGGSGPDEGAGTIRISPDVINNLGVRTAEVAYQALQGRIETVGYISYDEDKLVHIHPRVDGWIEKLYVKAVGEPVKKGQPLYQIYSPELVNAQEELLLAMDRKNRRLVEAAENRLVALQLPAAAIARLKKTKKVSQTVTFYAPQNGVIENLYIREGFFVKPGTMMLSIGDLSEVWVDAEVFERQAAQVKKGAEVTMSLDYIPGKTWQGQVDYVYPTLDPKTRTVKVRLRFSNEQGEFKPNMFAQVAINTGGDEKALIIPKEALIRTGSQDRVVLALGQGSFKSIEVKVGRVDSEHVEILSGLASGEQVVSSAHFLLDSESSKSSDFKRMNLDSSQQGQQAAMPAKVWVEATIRELMAGHRMVKLTHQAIDAWDWPEMTMDFIVAGSVDFSKLSTGLTLHIEIEKTAGGQYQISNMHIPGETEGMAAMKAGMAAMDHSQHQMGEMDHSQHQMGGMDHSQHQMGEMDHSQHQVGEMDHSQHQMQQQEEVSSATVTGVVNSLMPGHNMVNISRGAIEKWQRGPATLDFTLAETLDIGRLKVGQEILFTFEIRDGDFVITEIASQEQVSMTAENHANHQE